MMKTSLIILTSVIAMTGCAEQPCYQLSIASQQIKDRQILDPLAPERNDGITPGITGNYGKKVIDIYIKSAYETKSGREVTQQGSDKGK